jgi:hypothetical protein
MIQSARRSEVCKRVKRDLETDPLRSKRGLLTEAYLTCALSFFVAHLHLDVRGPRVVLTFFYFFFKYKYQSSAYETKNILQAIIFNLSGSASGYHCIHLSKIWGNFFLSLLFSFNKKNYTSGSHVEAKETYYRGKRDLL